MKPCAFDYIRVDALDEALDLLAEDALEARVLAGGQSLVPMLNMRLTQPHTLIDINRLPELDTLEFSTGDNETKLTVGSLVRQRQLEYYVQREPRMRLLYDALRYIGHPQTRNRGTVGGSLAHADPAAELPLAFIILGGSVHLRSKRGEREVAAEEFFQSYFTTAIQPDEMLIRSDWQLPTVYAGTAFKEFRRRAGDFAIIAAACTMELDSNRAVRNVKLGLGGVADIPLLVKEAQELIGERHVEDRLSSIAEMAASRLDLADDAQASAAYRRQLAMVLLRNILDSAYKEALAKEDSRAAHQS